MKYLFLLLNLSLLLVEVNAQSNLNLKFDKRIVECEDNWVAFQIGKDSTYLFGFIYIDETAGLTFQEEGRFKINKENVISVEKLKEGVIKVRLQANNVKVAIIPESLHKDLGIERIPEWLKLYKTDTASVKRLYKWGYMYNGWNECAKGLTYLLKAKEIEPNYKGLNVELAFSYNCLEDYQKAEQILETELKLDPPNAYSNKEYIYTISKTNNIEKAVTQYYKSLKTIDDKSYNAENCFNIMQFFYIQNDKQNFNIWYKELKKYTIDNKMMLEYADKMKKNIEK